MQKATTQLRFHPWHLNDSILHRKWASSQNQLLKVKLYFADWDLLGRKEINRQGEAGGIQKARMWNTEGKNVNHLLQRRGGEYSIWLQEDASCTHLALTFHSLSWGKYFSKEISHKANHEVIHALLHSDSLLEKSLDLSNLNYFHTVQCSSQCKHMR